MRRGAFAVGLCGVLVLAGLGSGTAAAGTTKLVEGTVYDTTCLVTGECAPPCPPPCGGPIAARGSSAGDACLAAGARIVCPLAGPDRDEARPDVLLRATPSGTRYPPYAYPLYTGEGVVKLRRRGSAAVLATVPIVEGHFSVRLPTGMYTARPFLQEPRCWSGDKTALWVTTALEGPVPVPVWVADSCTVDPGAG